MKYFKVIISIFKESDYYDARVFLIISFCISIIFLSKISFIESIIYTSLQNIVIPFIIVLILLRLNFCGILQKNFVNILIMGMVIGLLPSILSRIFTDINYFFFGGNIIAAKILNQPIYSFSLNNWMRQLEVSLIINLVLSIVSGISGEIAFFMDWLFSRK